MKPLEKAIDSEIKIEKEDVLQVEIQRELQEKYKEFSENTSSPSRKKFCKHIQDLTGISHSSVRSWIVGERPPSKSALLKLYKDFLYSNCKTKEDFETSIPNFVLDKIALSPDYDKLNFGCEKPLDFEYKFLNDSIYREIYLKAGASGKVGYHVDKLRYDLGQRGVDALEEMIESGLMYIESSTDYIRLDSKKVDAWSNQMIYATAKDHVVDKFDESKMEDSGKAVSAFYTKFLNQEGYDKVMSILEAAYRDIEEIGKDEKFQGDHHAWVALFQSSDKR
eukprot:GHVO01058479.1.p1 GENE.GHVO01058479.1~~GHVO01058479.1.p1  ORF type:complete len:279 (-),score=12.66 GHVO01058479.1:5-841(-)